MTILVDVTVFQICSKIFRTLSGEMRAMVDGLISISLLLDLKIVLELEVKDRVVDHRDWV